MFRHIDTLAKPIQGLKRNFVYTFTKRC